MKMNQSEFEKVWNFYRKAKEALRELSDVMYDNGDVRDSCGVDAAIRKLEDIMDDVVNGGHEE